MKPLRIAHIDTERTWRGGEQQVFSLIEGLKNRGHQNLLIVRNGSALAQRAQNLVPQIAVRPCTEWDFIAAHFVNRRLKQEKIDVVHAHTGHGVALGVFSTLGTKIPVVVTRRVDFHLSKNLFTRMKYNRVRHVVAISQGVKNILLEDGVPAAKISVIPSGVDFRRYQTVKPKTKKDLGLPSDCLLVGQVAALAPHKDQNNFLEAIALLKKDLPNVRAVIVGDGPLRSELEQKIAALNLKNMVTLLGFQENPLDFIPAFDVFCLSSKEEGLGTSLLDAMALQVPIVATKVGGIPELIEDGKTGFLAIPRDPKSLSGALKKALLDEYNEELLAEAAKKARKFDISNTILGMEALYERLSTGLST